MIASRLTEKIKTIDELPNQFEKGGIEELENPLVSHTCDVKSRGGLDALEMLGDPHDVILETKRRLLAV